MKRITDVWTRGWSGEWFFMGAAYGDFNEAGDFVTNDGIWIIRKSDNPGHKAFA